MNKLEQIEQLELKQQELIRQQNEVAEMIKNLKNNKKWQPETKDLYFYVSSEGDIFRDEWYTTLDDEFRMSTDNCFKTLEEAEQHLENIKTKAELRALADELNYGKMVDWENENQSKYYIYYDHDTHILDYAMNTIYQRQGHVYCLNSDFLQEAIKRIGEQNLINMIKGGL
jgi:hypothetical protein